MLADRSVLHMIQHLTVCAVSSQRAACDVSAFEAFKNLFFGQIVDQIFGLVFGQGFDHRYSVQYYRDGKIQCTVLLGRKSLLHRLISKKKFKLFYPLRELLRCSPCIPRQWPP